MIEFVLGDHLCSENGGSWLVNWGCCPLPSTDVSAFPPNSCKSDPKSSDIFSIRAFYDSLVGPFNMHVFLTHSTHNDYARVVRVVFFFVSS